MTGRVKHEKDVKESSGAQTVDQDSGIVRNVWEWIPIFRVGGGGGYLWRFGMGFLCGRSRRCGAVQRVVEFLLARQSLACECEDVPTVVSSKLIVMLKLSASGVEDTIHEQMRGLSSIMAGAETRRKAGSVPSTSTCN